MTTVNLEPEVRAFLDVLMDRHDRDRSYIVNALVKQLMAAEAPHRPHPQPPHSSERPALSFPPPLT